MDWDAAQAHLRYVEQRCSERFGTNSRFDAPLAEWRVERVNKLRDMAIHELVVDDQIDREILVTQRTKAALQGVPWYARRAVAARADGDEWTYWRSLFWDAPNGVRMTPEELSVLHDWQGRRERERRAQAPRAVGNMAGKRLVQPPFDAVVAEYGERFGQKLEALLSVAKARRRCAYLADLMLRAIESGEEVPVLEVTRYMYSQQAAPEVEPTVEDLNAYWGSFEAMKARP